jgi:hypothetical protein
MFVLGRHLNKVPLPYLFKFSLQVPLDNGRKNEIDIAPIEQINNVDHVVKHFWKCMCNS